MRNGNKINPPTSAKDGTLSVLNMALKELADRKTKGFLTKQNYGSLQINNIALKFVDLYSKVKSNQSLATVDYSLEKLPTFQQKEIKKRMVGQEQAEKHIKSLKEILLKQSDPESSKSKKEINLRKYNKLINKRKSHIKLALNLRPRSIMKNPK